MKQILQNIILEKLSIFEISQLSKIIVTCFIQNNDKLLLLQRARKDPQYKLWGIPGGKIYKNESFIQGLIRELEEELKLNFYIDDFNFLGKAKCYNESDGQYGLFLYHTYIEDNEIIINDNEHLNYKWVNIYDFEKMPLLFNQGLAFQYVYKKLKKLYEFYKEEKK